MANNMAEYDAVQVIRCRNCQEFKPGFIRPYLGWCGVWDTTVRETGFCHHGKFRCGEAEKPVWPPEEELALYLAQLPLHWIACAAYHKADTIWAPIIVHMTANLLSCITIFVMY